MYYKGTLEGESKSYIMLFQYLPQQSAVQYHLSSIHTKRKSVEIKFLFIHIQKLTQLEY